MIEDALFPFSNVKFSYEKGFYKKDEGGMGGNGIGFDREPEYNHGAHHKGLGVGDKERDKCRVCDACCIF